MIPGERTDGAGVPDERPRSAAPREGDDADELDEREEARRREHREAWRGLDEGSIMSAELLTSTLVWFGVGWLLDRVLGTMPWFMFAGVLLGNWTGLYLIWLRGQRNEEREAARAARGSPRPSDHSSRTTRSTAESSSADPTAAPSSDGSSARAGQRQTDDRTTDGDS